MADQLQDLTLAFRTTGFTTGTAQVNKLTASLIRMNAAVMGATKVTKAQGVAAIDTSGKVAKLGKSLASTAQTQKRLAADTRGTSAGFLGLGETLDHTIRKVAMWTLSTGAIFGTLRAFKAAGTVITEHDQDMINLRKVYSGAESDLAGLRMGIMDTARAMQSLHAAAFDAAVTVARTGRIGVDVTRLTEAALVAQNIAELQSADAVRYLNAALIQFNMITDQTIQVLDEWNELSNRTPATTEDLAMAVSVAGSVFRQAGSDIQYLNAMTAALVEITAKSGNIIGRAERTMAIFARRQSTVNLLARLGIRVFDEQTKQFIGIDRLLTLVAKKWATMNDEWRAAVAQAMAGARQQQFFIALMENQDIVLENLTTEWESYGSAMRENAIFLESITKKTEGLINALERLAINAGDAGVAGAIKLLIMGLTDMVNALNDANLVMGIVAAGAGILAARFAMLHASLGVFGALSLALGIFITTLTAMNNVFGDTISRMRELDDSIAALAARQSHLENMARQIENLAAAGETEKLTDMLKRISEIDAFRDLITDTDDWTGSLGNLRDEIRRIRDEFYELEIERIAAKEAAIVEKMPVRITRRPMEGAVVVGPGGAPAFVTERITEPTPEQVAEIALLQIQRERLELQRAMEDSRREAGDLLDEDLEDINRQVAKMREQAQIIEWMMAGYREEEVIRLRIAMIQADIEKRHLFGIELQRRNLEILRLQYRQQQLATQEAAKYGRVIGRGIGDALSAAITGGDVNRAMNAFVSRLGTLIGDTVAEKLRESFQQQAAMSAAQAAIAGNIVGALVSAGIGLFGDILFGERTEQERTTDALEDNTIQLRLLNDSIRDLTSFYINAPAGFAIPAGAPGYGGVGASVIAGGGPAAPAPQISNVMTISSGAIQVTQQPGQSGPELASQIEAQIAGRWGEGAQVEPAY